MSLRELIAPTIAALGWFAAAAIALALEGHGKLFALAVAGSATLTMGLICKAHVHATSTAIRGTLAQQKEPREMPMPIQIAHQIGFKQGWEAARVAHPDELVDFVDIFEKRFPTTPN